MFSNKCDSACCPRISGRLLPRSIPQVFELARPYFFRQGEEGELKALASHHLKSVLGDTYDVGDFKDAWDSGCEVEVVTKARKADLTGMDKSRIKTTVKTITLKAEVKIMYNNARAALVAKVWAVYREVNDVPPRPKGEQNTAGKKAARIEDPAWEVHAKQLQGAFALPPHASRMCCMRRNRPGCALLLLRGRLQARRK
jgi:hypothetical protein